MRFASNSCLLLIASCGTNQTHPPSAVAPTADDAIPCLPNLDGAIEATELEPTLGLPASYLISPNDAEPIVDVAGTVDAEGQRVWDWSAAGSSDERLVFGAIDFSSAWYASEFPDGEFAAALDAAGDTLGIYRHEDTGLYLLGIASTEEQPAEGETLLRYEPAVKIYAFPVEPGTTWSTTATVRDATVRGIPYAGVDTYEGEADGAGVFELPDLTLAQAQRVRLTTTIAPAIGDAIVARRVVFLFECIGEVARATSRVGETSEDFTTASEVRRLSL